MLLPIAAVIAGFACLVWGSDRFVTGASALARTLGVPPLVVGLTIVGVGTSAPEMLVSTIATLDGNPGIAIGNALGSNVANIGLVVAGTALVSPLVVDSRTLRREFPLMFAVVALAGALLLDRDLGRPDGAMLLAGAVAVIGSMPS